MPPFWDLVEKASESRMGRGRAGLNPLSPLAGSPWASLSESYFLHPKDEANTTRLSRLQDAMR